MDHRQEMKKTNRRCLFFKPLQLLVLGMHVLALVHWSLLVHGQEGGEWKLDSLDVPPHHEISIFAGSLLPFGIPGVRQEYPNWGLRYVHPLQIWHTEYSMIAANAEGVTFFQGSLSIRYDLKLNELATFLVYVGVDLNLYKRSPTIVWTPDLTQQVDLIEYDYNSVLGGHVGLAMVTPISEFIHIRGDCKMAGNPGSMLFAEIGLVFWLGGKTKEDSTGEEGSPPVDVE